MPQSARKSKSVRTLSVPSANGVVLKFRLFEGRKRVEHTSKAVSEAVALIEELARLAPEHMEFVIDLVRYLVAEHR